MIKGEKVNIKTIIIIFVICEILLMVLVGWANRNKYNDLLEYIRLANSLGVSKSQDYFTAAEYNRQWKLIWIVGIALFILPLLALAYWDKMKIDIIGSDQLHIIGGWGKKNSILPINTILSVRLSGIKGITVISTSGTFFVEWIKNREMIYRVLSDLITKPSSKSTQCTSAPDEIKKYKELYDSGLITQAEFEQKKKQLLNM